MSRHPTETVAAWLERILGHEGGASMDQTDPGNWTGGHVGAGVLKGTKWGIAANTYGHLEIMSLTKEVAADIYRRDFLQVIQADRFEDGVAFQLLDFAINSGPHQAIVSLQRALGVKPDGKVGPVTLGAIAARSESDVVMLVIAQRIRFMTARSNWLQHGRGWMNRMADNLVHASEDT